MKTPPFNVPRRKVPVSLLAFFALLFAMTRLSASMFSVALRNGSIVALKNDAGQTMAVESAALPGAGVLWEKGSEKATGGEAVTWQNTDEGETTFTFGSEEGISSATLTEHLRADADSGDLLLDLESTASRPGVKQVQWSLGLVPLDMNIIVPGAGGVRLTRDTPEDVQSFSYPMGWEAQLVIIEGDGYGFYVWSDDPDGNFKNLTVRRGPDGWLLTFANTNQAPFSGLTTCRSQTWRLNVYEGDWRVPARRYRAWMQAREDFIPLAEQTPSWVAGIRTVVYSGNNFELLDTLAEVFNPPQTMLYLNHWRKQEFDRMYPDYDQYSSGVREYVERAHALGFRVMLHLNFFGIDPAHPAYEGLKKYHIRSPNTPYQTIGYKNTRQNPPVEIAYINPASPEWRALYVEKVGELVTDLHPDALHLDQNFHVHNDNNGLIDGMTMSQGIIAYHQALRDSFPQIALGGEGMNEVSGRGMAFAQRHVYSVMRGTIDRAALSMAHPISSYLFLPFCHLYGWLGQPSADDNWELFNAWRENYRTWGTLPTVKTIRSTPENLLSPSPQMRYALDRAQYWQRHQVEPATDSPWPDEVAFPFQTDDGLPVVEMKDRSFFAGDEEIARVISGVSEVELPGTIPGWQLYNADKIFGLNPATWYPYFTEPRDLHAPHISELQEGFAARDVVLDQTQFKLETFQSGGLIFDCVAHLPQATIGLNLTGRGRVPQPTGDANLPHNAVLNGGARSLRSTPPSAAGMSTDFESDAVNRARGLGEVYAAFQVTLPEGKALRFCADVCMDGRSVGKDKTDGVTFKVTAHHGDETLSTELHHATATPMPLELDLTPFAGQTVTLELSAGAGPANDATEDRGLWDFPRAEYDLQTPDGLLEVAAAPGWLAQAARDRGYTVEGTDDTVRLSVPMPGHIVLTAPEATSAP